MSLKRKMLVTIVMFCLTMVLLMVGVWAVSTDNFTFSGTIQFLASDVNVTITGSVSGAKTNPTLQTLVYTTDDSSPTQTQLNSWKNNLDFKPTTEDITISFTIKNNGTRVVKASVSDQSTSTTNLLKTYKAAGSTYTLDEEREIAVGGSLSFSITFSIDDIASDISCGYKLFINLADERADYDFVGTPELAYSCYSSPSYYAVVTGYTGTETDLVIPSHVLRNGNIYKVTEIYSKAFQDNTSLISVTIPSSVTSIEVSAFYGCTGLTNITIPSSVTSIGNAAFCRCSSLTSITIPESITSIGLNTFAYCSALTSITIPESITSIGGSAFNGCTALTSITIPESVTSIGDTAFTGCTNLQTMIIKRSNADTITSAGSNILGRSANVNANLKIYVPADSVDAYKTASGWSTYASKIDSIENMPASASVVENIVDEVIIPASYGKRED